MKITCSCGAMIHDGTDGLPQKGHVIGDRDWNGFWDAVDRALERAAGRSEQKRARLAMELRARARARLAYECAACGRLWLDDGAGGLVAFTPEDGRAARVLDRP